MKAIKRGITTWGIAVMCTAAAQGQTNHAIRAVLPDVYSGVKDLGFFRVLGFGLGYDVSFSDGFSFGLEGVRYFGMSDGDMDEAQRVRSGNYTAFYRTRVGGWALNYKAFYFPNGSGEGFYLGTTLGVRTLVQTSRKSYVEDPYISGAYRDPFPEVLEGSRMVFPIGLRMGLRGSTDGVWGDLYFQMGMQLGAGKFEMKQRQFSAAAMDARSLYLGIGYAIGVGW